MKNTLCKGILLLCLMLAVSVNCLAGCEFRNKVTQHISMGTVNVPANARVGDTLASVSSSAVDTEIAYCQEGDTYTYKIVYMGGIPSPVGSAYNTNIPGIGIKVTSPQGTPYENPPRTSPPTVKGPLTYYGGNNILLIKTGAIDTSSTRNVTPGTAGELILSNGVSVGVEMVLDNATINLLPSVCRINNGQDINVHFDDIERSTLTNSYSSASGAAVVSKTVGFSCDDTNTHNFQAKLVFDGASWSGGDTLKTSNSNVGVVVEWNGSKMSNQQTFNTSFPGSGNATMKFSVVKNSGVSNDQVSTGAFNASATLVMNMP